MKLVKHLQDGGARVDVTLDELERIEKSLKACSLLAPVALSFYAENPLRLALRVSVNPEVEPDPQSHFDSDDAPSSRNNGLRLVRGGPETK